MKTFNLILALVIFQISILCSQTFHIGWDEGISAGVIIKKYNFNVSFAPRVEYLNPLIPATTTADTLLNSTQIDSWGYKMKFEASREVYRQGIVFVSPYLSLGFDHDETDYEDNRYILSEKEIFSLGLGINLYFIPAKNIYIGTGFGFQGNFITGSNTILEHPRNKFEDPMTNEVKIKSGTQYIEDYELHAKEINLISGLKVFFLF